MYDNIVSIDKYEYINMCVNLCPVRPPSGTALSRGGALRAEHAERSAPPGPGRPGNVRYTRLLTQRQHAETVYGKPGTTEDPRRKEDGRWTGELERNRTPSGDRTWLASIRQSHSQPVEVLDSYVSKARLGHF